MTVASRAVTITAMTADKMAGVLEHSQTSDRGEHVVGTESTEYINDYTSASDSPFKSI